MGNWGFRFEPSVWLGVIRAIVVAGSAFGLKLTAEQTTAIYLVAEAISTLIQRSVVTPTAETTSSVTVTRTESAPVVDKTL
jgi:hypothetical protein